MYRTLTTNAVLLFVSFLCVAQTPAASQDTTSAAHDIPVVDGAAGSCSLGLTVTAEGKPVYAASVKVHIAYGFGGFHKLDLEASTNVDGKVKFTGIPARVRRQTLEFQATKDQLTGTITYDPGSACNAVRSIALEKAKEQPNK